MRLRRNNFGNIDRRRFLITVGAASSALLLSRYAATTVEPNGALKAMNVENFAALENSIKANFGSGFRVVAQTFERDRVVVKIEHLENHYVVASSDLSDWQILHSSIS